MSISSKRRFLSRSRIIWSRNSTTEGRKSSLASLRPPMMLGLTVALAPARFILGMASVSTTLVTMRALALRARADRVTKRLSRSWVRAAMRPAARSMPASSSVWSWVASPWM